METLQNEIDVRKEEEKKRLETLLNEIDVSTTHEKEEGKKEKMQLVVRR